MKKQEFKNNFLLPSTDFILQQALEMIYAKFYFLFKCGLSDPLANPVT